MLLNGLNVFFLRMQDSRRPYPQQWSTWNTYSGESYSYSFRLPVLVLDDKTNILNVVKSKTVDPTTVTKLYFDSTSTYPRFKIKDTNYKRCIKYDKCEAVVIPDDIVISNFKKDYTIFEYADKNDPRYYAIPDSYDNPSDKASYSKICQHGDNLIDALKVIGTLPKGAKEVYKGKLSITDNCYLECITNILNTYSKLVRQGDLDKVINSSLEDITEETIVSLDDMLSSTDKTTVELGLKILQGLNVTNCPTTIACLLAVNRDNVVSNKAINTTGVQQVIGSLGNIKNYWRGTEPLYSLAYITKDIFSTISENDRKLSTLLIHRWALRKMNELSRSITDNLPQVPISISTYVE